MYEKKAFFEEKNYGFLLGNTGKSKKSCEINLLKTRLKTPFSTLDR